MKRATLRAHPDEEPEFQIAPMIDILLVPLVFFMAISSTEVLQTNDQIKLPVAKNVTRNERHGDGGQMIVNVLWDSIRNGGMLEVNEEKFGVPADVTPRITRHLATNPGARILVRADKEVRYEYTKQLLKAIGQANGTNVTFSVIDREISTAAPATP